MCSGGPVQTGKENSRCGGKRAGRRAKQARLPAPGRCCGAIPNQQRREARCTHPWTVPTAKSQTPKTCWFCLNFKPTDCFGVTGRRTWPGEGISLLIKKIHLYATGVFHGEGYPWKCTGRRAPASQLEYPSSTTTTAAFCLAW